MCAGALLRKLSLEKVRPFEVKSPHSTPVCLVRDSSPSSTCRKIIFKKALFRDPPAFGRSETSGLSVPTVASDPQARPYHLTLMSMPARQPPADTLTAKNRGALPSTAPAQSRTAIAPPVSGQQSNATVAPAPARAQAQRGPGSQPTMPIAALVNSGQSSLVEGLPSVPLPVPAPLPYPTLPGIPAGIGALSIPGAITGAPPRASIPGAPRGPHVPLASADARRSRGRQGGPPTNPLATLASASGARTNTASLPGDSLRPSTSQKPRTRTACVQCKRAKTRCDAKRPCGRCVRRGVPAHECVDAVPRRLGRKRIHHFTGAVSKAELARKQRQEPRIQASYEVAMNAAVVRGGLDNVIETLNSATTKRKKLASKPPPKIPVKSPTFPTIEGVITPPVPAVQNSALAQRRPAPRPAFLPAPAAAATSRAPPPPPLPLPQAGLKTPQFPVVQSKDDDFVATAASIEAAILGTKKKPQTAPQPPPKRDAKKPTTSTADRQDVASKVMQAQPPSSATAGAQPPMKKARVSGQSASAAEVSAASARTNQPTTQPPATKRPRPTNTASGDQKSEARTAGSTRPVKRQRSSSGSAFSGKDAPRRKSSGKKNSRGAPEFAGLGALLVAAELHKAVPGDQKNAQNGKATASTKNAEAPNAPSASAKGQGGAGNN